MSEPRDEPDSVSNDLTPEDEIERDDDPAEQQQPGRPEVEYPPPADRFTAPRRFE